MRYNKSICLLIAGFTAVTATAQKKQFTIAEATNGMATTLAPKSVKNPSWQPGTDVFWQADKRDGKDVWVVTDFAGKGKTEQVITSGDFPEKVNGLPALKWLNKDTAYFVNGQHVIVGALSNNKFTWSLYARLADSAENITVGKGRMIAYTLGNNLWYNGVGQSANGLSAETNKNIISGQTVHRNEFGIDGGIFFSPSGKSLAWYRMDQTMVNDYPVVKWEKTPAVADIVKYPMAGGTSHQVTLHVARLNSNKEVELKTGEPKDHYLTAVTWSPDEKYIFIAILNREQNHLWLNKYDATTGDLVKTLFEETDPKYVHPTHSLSFIPGKNNEFLWWSERDGYQHLYRYNTDGKLIRQVTQGPWVVNEIAGYTADGKNVIITSAKESPLEKHIYLVSLDKDKIDRIDAEAGMHTALVSEDGKFVYDNYNGAGIPRKAVIRATNGKYTKELLNADNTLADYDRPVIKNVSITAADGITRLDGKLILPTHFDSTRKYPVIVYLYNGPNVQLLHNSFPESGNLWYEYMAQHGYIVFTMDGRGSSNRGRDFEQATFRHLGDVEIADQLKGVDYLKSLPYVDANRLGIHGWSFGGFMTTSIMLKHPGVFKCAVAGGPVMDWKMYEVMYTERYMDTPGENPEGYENANLLSKVKNLKGKLMLIHGTSDDVVVWQQSVDFLKKAVDEGVQLDYFVYPGHEHNVRGKDRIHLMTKVSDYFDQYLR
jgi:dipeptidyl-peptidase-4